MVPHVVLRVVVPVMKCAGVLDTQAKGALSSLYAVASPGFTDAGAYVVPYAKIGSPSDAAMDSALAEKLWNWTAERLQEWL